ncbi:metal-sensing transcriptional repressor [Schaalia turicensis]
MEGGQDCKAVVTQLAATNSAIQRAGFSAISAVMRE